MKTVACGECLEQVWTLHKFVFLIRGWLFCFTIFLYSAPKSVYVRENLSKCCMLLHKPERMKRFQGY